VEVEQFLPKIWLLVLIFLSFYLKELVLLTHACLVWPRRTKGEEGIKRRMKESTSIMLDGMIGMIVIIPVQP
jgi:hypothetical protein